MPISVLRNSNATFKGYCQYEDGSGPRYVEMWVPSLLRTVKLDCDDAGTLSTYQVNETHRQECTVVLTTHNMEEAEALASSVGIMVGAAADPNLCTNLDLVCAKCCV